MLYLVTVKISIFQNGTFINGILNNSDYYKIFTKACGYKLSNISDFYNCVKNQSYTEEDLILGTVKLKEIYFYI